LNANAFGLKAGAAAVSFFSPAGGAPGGGGGPSLIAFGLCESTKPAGSARGVRRSGASVDDRKVGAPTPLFPIAPWFGAEISDPRRWVRGQLVRNNVQLSTRACKQSPFPEKSSAAENERCVEPLLTMASWPLALLRAARQRRSLRGTSRPAKRRVRPRTRPRRPRPAPSRVVACPRPLAPARRAARIGRRSESSPRARDGTEGLRRSPCPRTSTSSSSRNGACYS
jgi:hypothetical protein